MRQYYFEVEDSNGNELYGGRLKIYNVHGNAVLVLDDDVTRHSVKLSLGIIDPRRGRVAAFIDFIDGVHREVIVKMKGLGIDQ